MDRAAPKDTAPDIGRSGWNKRAATEPTATPREVLKIADKPPSEPKTKIETFRELFARDLNRVLSWLHRALLWIVLFAVISVVAGYAVTPFIKPRFPTSIDVSVDLSGLNFMEDDIFYESKQRDAQLVRVNSKLSVVAPTIELIVRSYLPQGTILAGAGGGLHVFFDLVAALGLHNDDRQRKFAAWDSANVQ